MLRCICKLVPWYFEAISIATGSESQSARKVSRFTFSRIHLEEQHVLSPSSRLWQTLNNYICRNSCSTCFGLKKETFIIVFLSCLVQMCVLESIAGLSASVVSEDGSCLQSSDVSIRVSLQKGSPVGLVFLLTGLNGSSSQSREMLRNRALYTIRNPFQGTQTNDIWYICIYIHIYIRSQ